MPTPDQVLTIFNTRSEAGPVRPISNATVSLASWLSQSWELLPEESRTLLLDIGALLYQEALNVGIRPGGTAAKIEGLAMLLLRR